MVSNFSYLFADCKRLRTIEKGENFYATIAHDLTSMFYNCQNLKSIDLSSAFEGCTNIKEIKLGTQMQKKR